MARPGWARRGRELEVERMAYIGVRVFDAHARRGGARHGKAGHGREFEVGRMAYIEVRVFDAH